MQNFIQNKPLQISKFLSPSLLISLSLFAETFQLNWIKICFFQPIFLNEVLVKLPTDPSSDEPIFHISHIDRVYTLKTDNINERWASKFLAKKRNKTFSEFLSHEMSKHMLFSFLLLCLFLDCLTVVNLLFISKKLLLECEKIIEKSVQKQRCITIWLHTSTLYLNP